MSQFLDQKKSIDIDLIIITKSTKLMNESLVCNFSKMNKIEIAKDLENRNYNRE